MKSVVKLSEELLVHTWFTEQFKAGVIEWYIGIAQPHIQSAALEFQSQWQSVIFGRNVFSDSGPAIPTPRTPEILDQESAKSAPPLGFENFPVVLSEQIPFPGSRGPPVQLVASSTQAKLVKAMVHSR